MVLTRRAAAQQRSAEVDGTSSSHHDHLQQPQPQSVVASKKKSDNWRQMMLLTTLASGICSCYLAYGIVQERLFSKKSAHGQAVRAVGPITTFLVMTQCVGNTIVAILWTWVQRNLLGGKQSNGSKNKSVEANKTKLNHPLLILTAFCYFAAMSCSNESINHVSYPTVVLAKSSKLIPAMIAGVLIERKSFSGREWAGALLITAGIIIFNWTRLSGRKGSNDGDDGDSPFGLVLLLASLTFDGALSSCQGYLKRSSGQFRPPTPMEFMLFTNTYSFFFLLPASAWSGQLRNGTALFLQSGSDAAAARNWIYLLNVAAAAGQVFIFLTIHCFSSLMCTTITTTRKFISILLSVWHFNHVFSKIQWLSVCMVFGGLYMEIAAKLNADGKGSSNNTGSDSSGKKKKKR